MIVNKTFSIQSLVSSAYWFLDHWVNLTLSGSFTNHLENQAYVKKLPSENSWSVCEWMRLAAKSSMHERMTEIGVEQPRKRSGIEHHIAGYLYNDFQF